MANVDWKKIAGITLGLGAVGYGLYAYFKWRNTATVKVNEFKDLIIKSVTPEPSAIHGAISISGSFQYRGPGGNYRVIAQVGHNGSFTGLYEDTGGSDYKLSSKGPFVTQNFTINIQLTDFTLPIGNPHDIQIRIYDDDKDKTVDTIVGIGLLNVTEVEYSTAYSVSPPHAGYYIKGGWYGTESGTTFEGSTEDYWKEIEVRPNIGWVFDHYTCTTAIYRDPRTNDNMVHNTADKILVAYFVPASQVSTWTFNVLPLAAGFIYCSVNGNPSVDLGSQGPENKSFNVTDNISLENYKFAAPDTLGRYYVLDYWILDGVTYSSTQPVEFYISDTVGHALTAQMKFIWPWEG